MWLITMALLFTGLVLGMQQMDVNPPAAAAREPEDGSITLPLPITIGMLSNGPFEHRHADGDAVLHLSSPREPREHLARGEIR
jgi:hypothetical protein